MQMKIEIEDRAGIKILHLQGELDADEGLALVREVTEALDGRGARAVIDMAAVGSINSAGISAIVRVKAQANTQEQTVVFANPSPLVSGVLATSKLDKFLEIHLTVDEAVRHLQE
jgi:anti-anti-sigma factor